MRLQINMPSPYEYAAQLLDLRNLHPRQVAVIVKLVQHYEPGGAVYAIHQASSGLTKIGRSDNVPRRLRALERMHGPPLTLLATVHCPCSVAAVERWLHGHFRGYWIRGEWFACDSTLFTDAQTFANLVHDAHHEILRKAWHDFILHRLVGSWVLDRDRVRAFLSK